jgi:uncharacterized ferritin-like protein (DUF455 family)
MIQCARTIVKSIAHVSTTRGVLHTTKNKFQVYGITNPSTVSLYIVKSAAAMSTVSGTTSTSQSQSVSVPKYDSIVSYGVAVLNEVNLANKMQLTKEAAQAWKCTTKPLPLRPPGTTTTEELSTQIELPIYPARPVPPELVDSMPGHKKLGVPLAIYIMHSLAHIELTAVEMYFDSIVRFAMSPQYEWIPREFYDDFISVIDDERRHFGMASQRLVELESSYGALPVHKALWQNGVETRHDLAARLAVVPLVAEARGIDAGPRFVTQLTSVADPKSAAIMQTIVDDELGHVAAGMKWFCKLAEHQGRDAKTWFQTLVKQYAPLGVVEPLNVILREQAGFPSDWYLPISIHPSELRNSSTPTRSFARPNNGAASQPQHIDSPNQSSPATSRRSFSSASLERPTIMLVLRQWPQIKTTAASLRSLALIKYFTQQGFRVACVSTNKDNSYAQELRDAGIEVAPVRLNSNDFEGCLSRWNPSIVLFDTFILEEQFGWRTHCSLPQAMRVLDMQDFHALRLHRQQMSQTHQVDPADEVLVHPEVRDPLLTAADSNVAREIASLLRTDLTIVVSDYEQDVLHKVMGVPAKKMVTGTFFYESHAVVSTLPDAKLLPDQRRATPFDSRQHCMSIGHFRHAPNVDSVHVLKAMWSELRAEIMQQMVPVAGESPPQLHVYGSYPSAEHMALSDPQNGFIVKGPAANQYTTLRKHRLLLAPLRFGAGVKGKLTDAFSQATPVVTTSIGAQGMYHNMTDEYSWGGVVTDSRQEFIRASAKLYCNQKEWYKHAVAGPRNVHTNFNFSKNCATLMNAIESRLDPQVLQSSRDSDYIMGMLLHSSVQGAEYMNRYLVTKKQLQRVQNDQCSVTT